MAERRMFTKKITDSDAFLDLPTSTQCLYFHLNMAADDDGFVNNPKKIQRTIGASDDDLRLLLAKSFILAFESGVIVIKHWRMHNYIQSDRYKPTDYTEEKSRLTLKKNKAYTFVDNEMYTKCIQNVSVGKDRLGKVRLGEVSVVESAAPSDQQKTYNDLCQKYGKEYVDQKIERAKRYNITNMETVAKWCAEDAKKKTRNNAFNNFPQREYDDLAEIEKLLLTGQS